MDEEKLAQILQTISKGDTSAAELLFSKPGGRKYFESLILLVISNLPYDHEEKSDLFVAFRNGLDKIENRIQHQKEGQKIPQTDLFLAHILTQTLAEKATSLDQHGFDETRW